MIILSHRGFWQTPDEKNSEAAFRRSFALGFGTETDVRDCGGELVISHDPPRGGELRFSHFLEILACYPGPLPIALNIKADGLQSRIKGALAAAPGALSLFLFDMSVPDAMVSLRHGLPCYTRHSDEEAVPCFYDRAQGIWLDAFHGEWYDERVVLSHLQAGKTVCVVSPELHGRDPMPLWSILLRCQDVVTSDRVLVCTDRPTDLQKELCRVHS